MDNKFDLSNTMMLIDNVDYDFDSYDMIMIITVIIMAATLVKMIILF